ncbi:MAG: hypothetical protein GKS00_10420 [Alphaproteobacteria bacterium]|nr:hypothetical protein [Alphaproteobacteria bacterium]
MIRHVAIALLALSTCITASARAEPVIVDLSENFVAITAGFTGTEVLLFGTTEGYGEVVVVIEGPKEEISVRRKEKVAGIWINGQQVDFKEAPAFYQVLSTSSLDEWLPLSVREKYQIGVEYLDLQPREEIGAAEAAEYRAALIRNKQRIGHYGQVENRLKTIGGRLFRSSVYFPANVPVGIYEVRTYLVEKGKIVSTRTMPLTINKIGIEADVFRVAHQHSALYGIAAIVIAVMAGLGGNALFRKG